MTQLAFSDAPAVAQSQPVVHPNQITDRNDARRFVTGGRAIFTLVGKTTRFTYRVSQGCGTRKHLRYVFVLSGPDNQQSYTKLGVIYPDADGVPVRYEHQNSPINATALSARSWVWFWNWALNDDKTFAQVQVWHYGRCGRCRRPLTDPASIRRGLGPICASK